MIFFVLWITIRRLSVAFTGLVPIAIIITSMLGMLSLANFNLTM